jgi:broad specificity phosphatase PhoE
MAADVHKMDSELRFGKYEGKTVAEVIKINPGWILWASENVSFRLFQPTAEVLQAARDAS